MVASWICVVVFAAVGIWVGCRLWLGTFWDSGAYVLVGCLLFCLLALCWALSGWAIVDRFWFIVWFVVGGCGFCLSVVGSVVKAGRLLFGLFLVWCWLL